MESQVWEQLEDMLAQCPLGYYDGKVITGAGYTETDIVEWLKRFHKVKNALMTGALILDTNPDRLKELNDLAGLSALTMNMLVQKHSTENNANSLPNFVGLEPISLVWVRPQHTVSENRYWYFINDLDISKADVYTLESTDFVGYTTNPATRNWHFQEADGTRVTLMLGIANV